jgi:hypothetical protein
MAFKFFCTSIIIIHHWLCLSLFFLWAHVKWLGDPFTWLLFALVRFCILRYSLGVFLLCLFFSLTNDTHILDHAHVISFAFDNFASYLSYVGLYG